MPATNPRPDPVPDAGIKNATVLKEDVPAFSSNNLGYFVRYRVISSDKNRSSHWSPYYLLLKGIIPKVPCSVSVTGTSLKVINMVWQHPKVSDDPDETEISIFKEYDVYIKTNLSNDTWSHIATVPSTSFTTLVPSGISSFQVAVQVPVYPKTYSPDAAIFTLVTPLVV
jgi:hypothetical protein